MGEDAPRGMPAHVIRAGEHLGSALKSAWGKEGIGAIGNEVFGAGRELICCTCNVMGKGAKIGESISSKLVDKLSENEKEAIEKFEKEPWTEINSNQLPKRKH